MRIRTTRAQHIQLVSLDASSGAFSTVSGPAALVPFSGFPARGLGGAAAGAQGAGVNRVDVETRLPAPPAPRFIPSEPALAGSSQPADLCVFSVMKIMPVHHKCLWSAQRAFRHAVAYDGRR